jgi:uncharacterized protein (DUF1697 family)
MQVAFLRAINIGGHSVKMDALRTLCGQCGLSNVETFIASGNVIFTSRAGALALEKKIETHLNKALGYQVATFIRDVGELAGVAAKAEALRAGWKNVYVGFLKTPPSAEQRRKVQAFASPSERFEFAG